MDDVIYREDALERLRSIPSDLGRRELDDSIKAIETMPSAQQWIPCSERLPERNGYYLVTGRQGAVNKRLYQDGYWYGNLAIIAWMPLPDPYKGEL